jgi:FkbM family methyltransferase
LDLLELKKKILVDSICLITKCYLKFFVQLFFPNFHRTSQSLYFQAVDRYFDLTGDRNGLRFDRRSVVGEKRCAKYVEKSTDLVNWNTDKILDGDVYFDIGANVGSYSLDAALKGADVYAFEPESGSYSVLTRNFFLNPTLKLVGFNVGISDVDKMAQIQITKFAPGYSNHQLDNAETEGFVFSQGVTSFCLDTVVYDFGLPVPNLIKIDVDGLEFLVIKGMKKLLQDGRLRGIAIEINTDSNYKYHKENKAILSELASHKFEEIADRAYLNKVAGKFIRSNYFFERS